MRTVTATVTVYPVVLYADPDAGMSWLEQALGFDRHEVVRDDAGGVRHAELRLGDAIVMLAGAGAGREPFRSVAAGSSLVYVGLDDVEAAHERARRAGADVVVPLADTEYGSRDFTVRDPEGNLWSFGSYRPEVGR